MKRIVTVALLTVALLLGGRGIRPQPVHQAGELGWCEDCK